MAPTLWMLPRWLMADSQARSHHGVSHSIGRRCLRKHVAFGIGGQESFQCMGSEVIAQGRLSKVLLAAKSHQLLVNPATPSGEHLRIAEDRPHHRPKSELLESLCNAPDPVGRVEPVIRGTARRLNPSVNA